MSRLRQNLPNASLLSLLLLAGAVQASDHLETIGAASDPLADILDFYAFMNPPCRTSGGTGCEAPPEELILALTVNPSATEDTQFSESVIYHINFENDVGEASQIDCSISADQVVTCAGLNGLSVSAPVGEVGVNGDIRVFAGLRDDPFFMDREALTRFSIVGVAALNPPGVDSYAGSNVLAIVVGIKTNSFPTGSGATDTNGHSINVQKVWVASERTRAAINAGVSGAWHNPDMDGQGWNIEMVGTGSGNRFLFYFYGYEDNGERLWLLGITDDVGDSSITADVLRFSGMGFGGNFDPSSLADESVGSMTFDFTDCKNATVTFAPSGNDLSAFTMPARRITNIASVDCVFSSEGQVDRLGRPLINLGFIPEEKRDAYNTAPDPDAWDSLFRADIEASLTGVDTADGIVGNSLNPPSVLAPIMADDRLQVDLEWSACLGLWGIEFSALVPQPNTNECGGRLLEEDVLATILGMTVNSFEPAYDDFVTANDVPFLTDFPFLAAPH
jgi:hypothetical protein